MAGSAVRVTKLGVTGTTAKGVMVGGSWGLLEIWPLDVNPGTMNRPSSLTALLAFPDITTAEV